jgi:hypothetical protein
MTLSIVQPGFAAAGLTAAEQARVARGNARRLPGL